MERTSELTEDINERSEVATQVAEAEQREAPEEMAEDEPWWNRTNSEVVSWQRNKACWTDGSSNRRSSTNFSVKVRIKKMLSSSANESPPSLRRKKRNIKACMTRLTVRLRWCSRWCARKLQSVGC